MTLSQAHFLVAAHDHLDSEMTVWNRIVVGPGYKFRWKLTRYPSRGGKQRSKWALFDRQGGHSNLRKSPQKVFDEVWSTIVTHRPTQAENDELKTMVSEKLCAIAASGVMDPEQLRSRTLARFEPLSN